MSEILELLEIEEDQAKEQAAIDAAVTATLASIYDLDWLPDLDELGEVERDRMTEELLRASDEEKETKAQTVDEQPQTTSSGAPFLVVDIRTKSAEEKKASLERIAATAAAKRARGRYTPRRALVPTASTIHPPANYTPPVTAASMHTEGEAGPPKIAHLMSLVIPAPEESPPHYT